MKKRTGRLHLNRETLRRLDENLSWAVGGAATGTCAGSGCPDICHTVRGSQCVSASKACEVVEEGVENGTVVVVYNGTVVVQ